jgi:hypothetical protein
LQSYSTLVYFSAADVGVTVTNGVFTASETLTLDLSVLPYQSSFTLQIASAKSINGTFSSITTTSGCFSISPQYTSTSISAAVSFCGVIDASKTLNISNTRLNAPLAYAGGTIYIVSIRFAFKAFALLKLSLPV